MILEISMYPWNPHHNLYHKHIHHLQFLIFNIGIVTHFFAYLIHLCECQIIWQGFIKYLRVRYYHNKICDNSLSIVIIPWTIWHHQIFYTINAIPGLNRGSRQERWVGRYLLLNLECIANVSDWSSSPFFPQLSIHVENVMLLWM